MQDKLNKAIMMDRELEECVISEFAFNFFQEMNKLVQQYGKDILINNAINNKKSDLQ